MEKRNLPISRIQKVDGIILRIKVKTEKKIVTSKL